MIVSILTNKINELIIFRCSVEDNLYGRDMLKSVINNGINKTDNNLIFNLLCDTIINSSNSMYY